jgi:acetyl-CoA acetyltransferase
MFALEACAELAADALADAGIEKREVDGLVLGFVPESPMFGPSAAAEYLAVRANFAETVDLGGATACGMIWRAAAAIEVGACETVLVLCPMVPAPPAEGADPGGKPAPGAGAQRAESERSHKMSMPLYLGGDAWGSPQGQFEIPEGLVAATPSFAMVAQRYRDRYGLSGETLAKIAVAARTNAQANPKAIFHGKPITIEDVMCSPTICDPLKLLEIVMPCFGGGALVITTRERAERARHRPVFVSGFGEHLTHKSISYAPDLLDNPIRAAAERAFAMAGASRDAVDLVNPYDCYTITVLVTLENAGFCGKGEGGRFVEEHDLTFRGDFPLNTHGGQLGCGQAGLAGGLSHATEAVLQLQGRAGERQLAACDLAYVNGTGGMMAEQVALVLEGA